MKKLLTTVLALFAVLSLVPGLVAAQDDTIEITFVHIFGDDLRPLVIQSLADDFMAENPGITVTPLTAVADASYEETFNAALRAADQGDAYNIVQVESGLTQQAVDSGYFIPLSDVASEDQLTSIDDLLPSIRAFYDLGDAFWALPWNVSNPVLYINRDMFAAAGLDPDTPPTTFEEVTAACEAIMNTEALALEGCINWPMDTWFAEQWLAMKGEPLVNNDNGRTGRATEVFFTGQGMVDIVSWWGDLGANGYYFYSGTTGSAGYNPEGIAFLSGSTAMSINSTAGLSLFQQFAQFDLGIAPLITPSAEENVGVTIGGGSLWLSADQSEEEAQAALDFILFLNRPENVAIWHAGSGYLPVTQGSVAYLENLPDDNTLLFDLEAGMRVGLDATNWFEVNPAFRIAYDQLAATEATIATAGAVIGPSDEVRNALIQAFQSVIDAGADPLEALEAAKAQADAALADYNRDVE